MRMTNAERQAQYRLRLAEKEGDLNGLRFERDQLKRRLKKALEREERMWELLSSDDPDRVQQALDLLKS